MITEDYCSEELTKLLLEKGCPLEKVRRRDGRPVYFTLPTDHPDFFNCDTYYIPTHASIMKWLRDEYTIVINIFGGPIGNTGRIKYDFSVETQEDDYLEIKDFFSYEETVEAAILFVLNELL